jgi:hypothetical protein
MCFEHADRLQDARAAQITRVALLVEAGPLVQFHARAELVHLEFALGNIDEAIARGRRLLADVTQPILEKFPWIMVALAWPMVADSRLEEAAELLKKGLPLLKGIGTQWQILDLLAQLWVKLGDVQRAIQLIACADQIYKLRGYSRAPHAERRRTRLMSELARDVRAAELAHLRDLGTALSEEEALVLAMDFPQSFERKKPERGSTLRSERNAAG